MRPETNKYAIMSVRQSRLRTMTAILTAQVISSQEALQKALRVEGLNVTQATLSRDLKLLKIIKTVLPDGTYKYVLPISQKVDEKVTGMGSDSLHSAIKEIGFSGHFAVVKTRPGYASAVAYDIDLRSEELVLGTIAGDDTVLVIPREGHTRETLHAYLLDLWNK